LNRATRLIPNKSSLNERLMHDVPASVSFAPAVRRHTWVGVGIWFSAFLWALAGSSASGLAAPRVTPSTAALGFGVGTLVVTPSGAVTLVATLSDGTKLSRGTSLTRNGVWYLFTPLYATSGALAGLLEGTIQFEATPQVSDLDGAVTWLRPALTKKPYPATVLYPGGFDLATHLYGAAYNPKGSLVLTPGGMDNTFKAEGGSAPGGSLSESALAGKAVASIKVTGANSLSLTVTRATGVIAGSFKETAESAASPINAIIYQGGSAASIVGSFRDQPKGGTNEGGAVSLSSP
jgi:hypothetical protein